jgi:hypothetical protein
VKGADPNQRDCRLVGGFLCSPVAWMRGGMRGGMRCGCPQFYQGLYCVVMRRSESAAGSHTTGLALCDPPVRTILRREATRRAKRTAPRTMRQEPRVPRRVLWKSAQSTRRHYFQGCQLRMDSLCIRTVTVLSRVTAHSTRAAHGVGRRSTFQVPGAGAPYDGSVVRRDLERMSSCKTDPVRQTGGR